MSTHATHRTTPQQDPRYHPAVPVFWWTRKASYLVFVLRELSSIFVAWLVLFLLLFVRAVGRSETAYEEFLDWAASPWLVTLNVIALGFILLHTVTWFSLTPQAMAPRVRGKRVPPAAIIGAQYVGLAVVSAFVVWVVLG